MGTFLIWGATRQILKKFFMEGFNEFFLGSSKFEPYSPIIDPMCNKQIAGKSYKL